MEVFLFRCMALEAQFEKQERPKYLLQYREVPWYSAALKSAALASTRCALAARGTSCPLLTQQRALPSAAFTAMTSMPRSGTGWSLRHHEGVLRGA